ncbi:MAG: hypothetical protein IJT97_08635 [Bacteroidaceae bacterium]|nr:hypothetical protein [Bacteroidaceae bacterium]
MKKQILLSSLLCATLATQAGVDPKVKPETLVNGHEYVLVNKAQTANQYMSRTSWDGALYFLGEADSKYADYAFSALLNEDGTWSFTRPTTEQVETGEYDENGDPIMTTVPGILYLGLPEGSPNVNFVGDEVKWGVDAKSGNFYNLILGEGNNSAALAQAPYTSTGDLRLHLNKGSQYFVATYFQGPWYPDCVGGITETEDETTGDVFFEANDSTSFLWGFVSVEKIPAYMEDMKVVKLINDFEENYCFLDEYEDGFKLSYEAATALYNSADYNEDDAEVIKEMLNQKIELYNEIEAAFILNEDEDPVLAAAIENAMELFNKTTDAAALAAATETLKKAETDYSMGTGDVTSLGKNMSFEDLSAQDGNQTSSVAAPPYGWNVYVNGVQATTADEVRSAGVANWHGVNDDCDGDIKDGLYGFGIWTSSVPEYEISQTIKDLDNGTYIITAGLMVGANGNGSRRTTQRIFGNLNSTYFALEEDYDLSQLDNSEVYAFAGLSEEVTDRTLQPVEVRAFVYDGTLTFGVRTDGNISAANRSNSNGAGGDGWFKTDNFKIQKIGYVPADAIAVYDHYVNILQEYNSAREPMSATVADELEEKVDQLGGMTEKNTLEEIVAGILDAKDFLATVDASVKVYQKLGEALEQHYMYLEQYSAKMGADAYSDIIMEAEEAYQMGTAADAAAVDSIIAVLNEALQECIQSDVIEPGMELTDYIQNPSFEDYSAQGTPSSGGVENAPKGWNLYIDGALCSTSQEIKAAGITGWCAINGGDNINVELEDGTIVTNQCSDGTHMWGIWNGTIPEIELSQTLKSMPAGTYTLTCDVLVQYNWAGYCITTQRIFANDYVAMYSYEGNYENNMPQDAQDAIAIDNLVENAEVLHLTYGGYECESPRSDYSHKVSLTFGLAEKGDINIGFRTNNIDRNGIAQGSGKGWFKLDNWRLTYDSEEVPVGADVKKPITLDDITALIDKYLSTEGEVQLTDITNLIDQYLAQ